MDKRITWKWVRESKFPALVSMAVQAGLDPRGWELTHGDTPILVVNHGMQRCSWSTPRECADYFQAWIDCLSLVAMEREPRSLVTDDDNS